MADSRRSSDFLLILGVAVVAVVGGAWLLIAQPWREPSIESVAVADPRPAVELGELAPPMAADPLESALEAARFAERAGLLFEPANGSAWQRFGDVLELEPGHPEATEARRRLAAQLSARATAALEQGRLEDARVLIGLFGEPLPAVARDVAARFAAERDALVPLAAGYVEAGRDARAEETFALAAALGVPDATLQAARSEALAARRAVTEAPAPAAAAAATPAQSTPTPPVEPEPEPEAPAEPAAEALAAFGAALADDRLLAPRGDNAKLHLAEAVRLDAGDPAVETARRAFSDRLLTRAAQATAGGDAESAEVWLSEAETLGVNLDQVGASREALDALTIRLEAERPMAATELTMVDYVPPRYPPNAIRRSEEGWVDVDFIVTRDGTTRDLTVKDSSHESMFHEATLEAVARWRFEPRVIRGTAVDQRTYARVTFRLE